MRLSCLLLSTCLLGGAEVPVPIGERAQAELDELRAETLKTIAELDQLRKRCLADLAKEQERSTKRGALDEALAIRQRIEALGQLQAGDLVLLARGGEEAAHALFGAPMAPDPVEGRARELKVAANDLRGTSLGQLRKGQRFTLRYVSGTWTAGTFPPYDTATSPDAETVALDDLRACIWTMRGSSPHIAAVLPGGTAKQPFVLEIEADGEYALRIRDLLTHDNSGTVVYRIAELQQP